MAIKCLIPGAGGRMGGALARAIHRNEDFVLYGAVERQDHPDIAKDIGSLLGLGVIDVKLENDIRNVILATDVIIDFTWPDATLFNLEVAVDKQKAIVIGTTGFDDKQRQKLQELAPQTRTLLAPNMSLGVNIMFHLAKLAAGLLGEEYDAEIVEAHHRRKIDSPSGTALELGRRVAEAWESDLDQVRTDGRKGSLGERPYGTIGFHAVRGGDIVGEHQLIFAGPGERLEIVHRAESRDNFVRGALRAAYFLCNQTDNGLYSMADVLKLP